MVLNYSDVLFEKNLNVSHRFFHNLQLKKKKYKNLQKKKNLLIIIKLIFNIIKIF